MKKAATLSFILISFFILSCQDPNQNEKIKEPRAVTKKETVKKQENKNPPPKKRKPTAPAKEKTSKLPLAQIMLKKLATAPETRSGYDRDLFNHWISQRGECDTRDIVLERQNKKRGPCGAAFGLWFSVYDGELLRESGDLDVDHMVPLAEAWDSGARSWPAARKEAYANDLYPYSLIAVSASSNREKSDQDPSEWLPENQAFVCQYAARWIAVKFRWRLSADPREAKALRSLAQKCPAKSLRLSKSWEKGGQVKDAQLRPKKNSKGPARKAKRKKRDPIFSSCSAAIASGYGNYRRGKDPEYRFYRDADKDGIVCE